MRIGTPVASIIVSDGAVRIRGSSQESERQVLSIRRHSRGRYSTLASTGNGRENPECMSISFAV
jgi:hypothetical protein